MWWMFWKLDVFHECGSGLFQQQTVSWSSRSKLECFRGLIWAYQNWVFFSLIRFCHTMLIFVLLNFFLTSFISCSFELHRGPWSRMKMSQQNGNEQDHWNTIAASGSRFKSKGVSLMFFKISDYKNDVWGNLMLFFWVSMFYSFLSSQVSEWTESFVTRRFEMLFLLPQLHMLF